MNLETKRNALLNSVASSGGGLELLETITVTEPMAKIDFEVDTSQYGTFIIVGDLAFTSNTWLYYGVNGTTSDYYSPMFAQTTSLPNSNNAYQPIIVSKTTDDYVSFNGTLGGNIGTKVNTAFSSVTQITLSGYGGAKFDTGTELKLYGMKESLTDLGA